MQPRWLDPREQRAWRGFLRLVRLLQFGMEHQLAESGLSAADFQLLVPLSEAPEGRMRPRDLGAAVKWDRSRLSHQLRRMEQRGLVRRDDCATDARGTVIQLTDDGLETVRRAAPGHVEWVRTHFIDLLSGDELRVLTELAERVSARLEPELRAAHVAPD